VAEQTFNTDSSFCSPQGGVSGGCWWSSWTDDGRHHCDVPCELAGGNLYAFSLARRLHCSVTQPARPAGVNRGGDAMTTAVVEAELLVGAVW